jgi:hypothetical protein
MRADGYASAVSTPMEPSRGTNLELPSRRYDHNLVHRFVRRASLDGVREIRLHSLHVTPVCARLVYRLKTCKILLAMLTCGQLVGMTAAWTDHGLLHQ